MKTGRNDPCPCGSGKKYKRCCWNEDEKEKNPEKKRSQVAAKAADVAETVELGPFRGGIFAETAGWDIPVESSTPFKDAFPDRSPYAQLRELEDTPVVRRLRRKDPEEWTLGTVPGVASLATEDIQKRLSEIGIDASRDAFLAAAEGRLSAWDVGLEWLENDANDDLPFFAESFCCIAACELWKRFCPERPSTEMLDDWMQDGYDHLAAGKQAEAARVWLDTWDGLRSRLTPEMTTLTAADSAVRGRALIFNWAQDLTMTLLEAALDDKTYGELGVRYVEELLEQFSEEDESIRQQTQADLGCLLYRAGRPDDGERVLRQVIEEFPDEASGYCHLADEIAGTDPAEALRLLESARDRPVADGADWDLESRIEYHKTKPPAS